MSGSHVAILVCHLEHQLDVLHRCLLIAVVHGQGASEGLSGEHQFLLKLQLDGHAYRLSLRRVVKVGLQLVNGSYEHLACRVDIVAIVVVAEIILRINRLTFKCWGWRLRVIRLR